MRLPDDQLMSKMHIASYNGPFLPVSAKEEVSETINTRQHFTSPAVNALVLLSSV